MARSAADLKAAMLVLGGPDNDEAIAYRWSLPPARGTRLADYRIGYVLDDPLCPLTAEVAEVLGETIKALRTAGAFLEEGWPASVKPAEQFEVWFHLFSAFFKSMLMRDADEEPLRRKAARADGSYETNQRPGPDRSAQTVPPGELRPDGRAGRLARILSHARCIPAAHDLLRSAAA